MNDTLTPVMDTEYSEPKVSGPVFMDFPTATRKVLDGKRVARAEWNNADYCVLKDEEFKIFTTKEGEKLPKFHNYIVAKDILGEDWIVLPDLS